MAAAGIVAAVRVPAEVRAAGPAPGVPGDGDADGRPDAALVAALRQWRASTADAVAVLLWRHAATEPGIGDPAGFRLDDCTTQRNLSAAGRAQARRFGAACREAGLGFDAVRSSRWCRCLDTARLAFGAVEPWPALDSIFESRDEEPARTRAVRQTVAGLARPARWLLVTHQVNVAALVGTSPTMGEALGVRIDASGWRVEARFGPA